MKTSATLYFDIDPKNENASTTRNHVVNELRHWLEVSCTDKYRWRVTSTDTEVKILIESPFDTGKIMDAILRVSSEHEQPLLPGIHYSTGRVLERIQRN